VVEVADQLGIERFAVEGLSGGGPYALACAYKIPHRVTSCGLIATATGPFMGKAAPASLRLALWMLEHLPWMVAALVRLGARMQGRDAASIEKRLLRNGARLGAADQQCLSLPQVRTAFAQAIADGSRQGADAPTRDGMIFAAAWGFQPEEITFEKVFLWHGEQDRLMPVAAARMLAQALPHCKATFYPTEGHLSTFVNHTQDIWKALSV
jgi:pimeloyl-ACP methyl ester carboxylesterase